MALGCDGQLGSLVVRLDGQRPAPTVAGPTPAPSATGPEGGEERQRARPDLPGTADLIGHRLGDLLRPSRPEAVPAAVPAGAAICGKSSRNGLDIGGAEQPVPARRGPARGRRGMIQGTSRLVGQHGSRINRPRVGELISSGYSGGDHVRVGDHHLDHWRRWASSAASRRVASCPHARSPTTDCGCALRRSGQRRCRRGPRQGRLAAARGVPGHGRW